MSIGERIALRRESLDLKQYQIAEKIGVTKATMCKYERDVNIPNADILAKLAQALGTTTDYLCGNSDNPVPYGEDWVYVGEDKELYSLISLLSHDDKIRLSERARALSEQKNKPMD